MHRCLRSMVAGLCGGLHLLKRRLHGFSQHRMLLGRKIVLVVQPPQFIERDWAVLTLNSLGYLCGRLPGFVG